MCKQTIILSIWQQWQKEKIAEEKKFQRGERRDTRKGLNSNQFESLSGHWPPGRKHSQPENIRSILSVEVGPPQTYLVNWTWITVRHMLDIPCLSCLFNKEHSHTKYTSSHDLRTFLSRDSRRRKTVPKFNKGAWTHTKNSHKQISMDSDEGIRNPVNWKKTETKKTEDTNSQTKNMSFTL